MPLFLPLNGSIAQPDIGPEPCYCVAANHIYKKIEVGHENSALIMLLLNSNLECRNLFSTLFTKYKRLAPFKLVKLYDNAIVKASTAIHIKLLQKQRDTDSRNYSMKK